MDECFISFFPLVYIDDFVLHISPRMSELHSFLNVHRDYIENIVDLLLVATHFYLPHNEYSLTKNNQVKNSFFFIGVSYWFLQFTWLEKSDVKEIFNKELTYANTIRTINLSMSHTNNNLTISFQVRQKKKSSSLHTVSRTKFFFTGLWHKTIDQITNLTW
jgi:hypothetical protein